MASSELFLDLLDGREDNNSLSTTVGQENLGEAVVEVNDSLTPIVGQALLGEAMEVNDSLTPAVGRCETLTNTLISGEAAGGLMPGNLRRMELPPHNTDVGRLSDALIQITKSLSGVVQEVSELKQTIEKERRGGGVAVPPSPSSSYSEHRGTGPKRTGVITTERLDAAVADLTKDADHSVTLGSRYDPPTTDELPCPQAHSASADMFDFIDSQTKQHGPAVSAKLASLVKKFTTEKIPIDKMQAIEDRNLTPENINVGVPKTNNEIWKQISKGVQDRDRQLQKLQHSIGLGLKPLLQASDTLVKKVDEEKELSGGELRDLLRSMIDALCVLSSTHFTVTQMRRQEIRGSVAPQYQGLCDVTSNPIDMEWLLGSDMLHKMEEASKEQKISQTIAARFHPYKSTTSARPHFLGTGRGNWRSSRGRSSSLGYPHTHQHDHPHYQQDRQAPPSYKKGKGGKNRRR